MENMADVILGYDDLESYQIKQYPISVQPVGRNANRIGNAVITIDGKDYKLEANNGPNNLHSGPDLYHSRFMGVLRHTRQKKEAVWISF